MLEKIIVGTINIIGDLISFLKPWVLLLFDTLNYLASEWLFLRLGPMCLVIDSIITYIIVAKKNKDRIAAERKKAFKLYWKFTFAKTCFVSYLAYLIVSDKGEITYSSLMNIMLVYYIYTVSLVLFSTIYLFLRDNKSDGRAIKDIATTRRKGNDGNERPGAKIS